MGGASTRIKAGSAALAVAGLLLLLSPVTRPWTDESTVTGAAEAMGSGAWVVSHQLAMLGLVLVVPGVVALWALVRETPAEPVAGTASVLTWLGVALTLPYYGAETFGLHAVAAVNDDGALLEIVDAFRFHPVAISGFGLGLLALGLGAVVAAVAINRSGVLPRLAGIPFAASFVLFLPQFLMPAPFRIGHGLLAGVGCGWVAWTLWSAASAEPPKTPARR